MTHGTMFRRAVEEGIVDASRSIQVGLRGSLYTPEDMRARRPRLHVGRGARDRRARPRRGHRPRPGDGVRRGVRDCGRRRARPGVRARHRNARGGGLTSRELLAILRGLAGAGETIAGADVVEVAPAYDPAGQTAVAAANAAYELVSVMAMEGAAVGGGEH